MKRAAAGRRHPPGMTRILVIAAGAVLLLPLIAMQFTRQVAWTPIDFAAAAILMAIAIGLVELLRRRTDSTRHRGAGYAVVGIGFLLVWAQLAVGIVGD